MVNKRGIELSINFIVVLIITLVIFGFGVRFISTLFTQAKELKDISVNELDQKIEDLVCDNADRVCTGIGKKTIQRNSLDVFGIKIFNIGDNPAFTIDVTTPVDASYTPPQEYLGFDKNNQKILISPDSDGFHGLIIYPQHREIQIEKNTETKIGLGVQVPKNAVVGTYILNARIQNGGADYGSIQKLYVVVP